MLHINCTYLRSESKRQQNVFFSNLSVSGETFFASGARQAAILVLLFGGKKVLREKNCTTGQSGDKNCINKG
jgi:hypothetical protein